MPRPYGQTPSSCSLQEELSYIKHACIGRTQHCKKRESFQQKLPYLRFPRRPETGKVQHLPARPPSSPASEPWTNYDSTISLASTVSTFDSSPFKASAMRSLKLATLSGSVYNPNPPNWLLACSVSPTIEAQDAFEGDFRPELSQAEMQSNADCHTTPEPPSTSDSFRSGGDENVFRFNPPSQLRESPLDPFLHESASPNCQYFDHADFWTKRAPILDGEIYRDSLLPADSKVYDIQYPSPQSFQLYHDTPTSDSGFEETSSLIYGRQVNKIVDEIRLAS